MRSKITYLLGAGASFNALPLIKNGTDKSRPGLPVCLKNYIEINTASILTFNSWNYEYLDILNSIADRCIEFGTPDLYAKFLLETNDLTTYNLLKRFLSNYFMFKQRLDRPSISQTSGYFDYRALTFLTTIAKDQKIPKNIKILSWNYDEQIEMAAIRLKPVNSKVFNKLNGFTSWPNYRESFDYDSRHQHKNDDIFLLHLNGVAGYSYSESDMATGKTELFDFKLNNGEEQLLSFAWEEDPRSNLKTFVESRIKKAIQIAKDTEILVIIGYSFPFFNRKLDGIILEAMIPTLQRIYYQDPILDGSQLPTLFDIPPQLVPQIVHIKQTENYHVPFEM